MPSTWSSWRWARDIIEHRGGEQASCARIDDVLSFGFSDEQEALREAVAAFGRRELAPTYVQHAAEDRVPEATLRALGDLGVLGIGLPEHVGGSGRDDPVSLGLAVEEI